MQDDTDSEVSKILRSVLFFVGASIIGGIILMVSFMIFYWEYPEYFAQSLCIKKGLGLTSPFPASAQSDLIPFSLNRSLPMR